MTLKNLEDETDLSEDFRSEVNFLTRPFFALTTKDVFGRRKTEFKTVVERRGQRLEISWKVSANPEYGYPGPFEKKVHRAIEQILEEEGFPIENPIQFSIYSLCDRIGINPGGKQYKRVKEAIERVIMTGIQSKGAFYQKNNKRWVDKTFHLYDTIIFTGEDLDNGDIAETNYLYLNDLYLESLNARYVKPLDWDHYQSLDTNVARRLYELLGVKFYGIFGNHQLYIRYRYTTLCQLMPLSRCKYLSAAKQRLDPAHQELRKTGFLEKVVWDEFDGKKDWYIYYYPGPRAELEIKRSIQSSSTVKKRPEVPAFLTEGQKIDISSWVSTLTKELKDTQNKNKGFYTKLAKLIVQGQIPEDLIWRSLSEAKSEDQMRDLDPDKEPIKSRSAYFTDLLKRRLNQKNRDLHKLLQSI